MITKKTPGSDDRTAKVWDTTSGKETLTLKGHGGLVRAVAFTADGHRIITGSSVAISTDGQWIVSGSANHTCKVWDATGGRELLTSKGSSRILTVGCHRAGKSSPLVPMAE